MRPTDEQYSALHIILNYDGCAELPCQSSKLDQWIHCQASREALLRFEQKHGVHVEIGQEFAGCCRRKRLDSTGYFHDYSHKRLTYSLSNLASSAQQFHQCITRRGLGFMKAHKPVTIYSGSDRLNNQLDIWAAAGKSYLDEQGLKRSGELSHEQLAMYAKRFNFHFDETRYGDSVDLVPRDDEIKTCFVCEPHGERVTVSQWQIVYGDLDDANIRSPRETAQQKKLAMLQYTIDKIASKNNKCREKVLFVDDDGGSDAGYFTYIKDRLSVPSYIDVELVHYDPFLHNKCQNDQIGLPAQEIIGGAGLSSIQDSTSLAKKQGLFTSLWLCCCPVSSYSKSVSP